MSWLDFFVVMFHLETLQNLVRICTNKLSKTQYLFILFKHFSTTFAGLAVFHFHRVLRSKYDAALLKTSSFQLRRNEGLPFH